MATPTFFWFPVIWNIIFYPFPLSLGMSLELKWVCCTQQKVLFCFLIYPDTSYLLIGEFNPFTLKLIMICKGSLWHFLLPSGWFSIVSFPSICVYFVIWKIHGDYLRLCSRFLLCDHHEVDIEHLIDKNTAVLFLIPIYPHLPI